MLYLWKTIYNMKTLSAFKLSLLFVLVSIQAAFSQSFTEGFDNISNLPSSGWVLNNMSYPLGNTSWFQGTDIASGGPFNAYNGATNSYIGANFNNVYQYGTISNWLISPVRTFNNGDIIKFYTRASPDNMWADRLEVRLSQNGNSSYVGSNETTVGDFSNLLLSINPNLLLNVYPYWGWTQYTITISGLSGPVTGRFAFRYYVTSAGLNGTNSDYIGIDNVEYISVCTPITVIGSGLTAGTTGVAYNGSVSQSGGVGTVTYSISGGTLPPGLTLNPDGSITGIPTTPGLYNFAVTATGSNGCSGSLTTSIIVSCPTNSASFTPGTVVCSNGGLYTLVEGQPAGGTYSGIGVSNGMFDPSVGTQTITYMVTDAYNCTNTATGTITVSPAPIFSLGNDIVSTNQSELIMGPSGMSSYLWNTGETTSAILVNQPGTYILVVTNSDGCTASDTINFFTTFGVEENFEDEAIKLYPNPTTGDLNLVIENDFSDLTISILNVNGQVLNTVNGTQAEKIYSLSLSSYPAGIYFVRLNTSKQIKTYRVVKL